MDLSQRKKLLIYTFFFGKLRYRKKKREMKTWINVQVYIYGLTQRLLLNLRLPVTGGARLSSPVSFLLNSSCLSLTLSAEQMDSVMSTSSLVSSLSDSLRQVPPAAVPPLLDCVLASTGASPSSLFTSLLDSFPLLTEVRGAYFFVPWDSGSNLLCCKMRAWYTI